MRVVMMHAAGDVALPPSLAAVEEAEEWAAAKKPVFALHALHIICLLKTLFKNTISFAFQARSLGNFGTSSTLSIRN